MFILVIALIVAAVIGGYYFLTRPQGANVGIEFTKPSQVLVGQPFNLGISLSNYSDKILENAKLVVMLPASVAFAGKSSEQRVLEQTIGDLGPGSLNQQTLNLVVLDGPNSLKHIDAKLLYKLSASSGAQFENQASMDIAVGQPVVGLNFTLPEKVISGESFDLIVTYDNNTDQDIKNAYLKINYPPNFQFAAASANPSRGNNNWTLGTLPRGSSDNITITGMGIGPAGATLSFSGDVGADILGQKYTLNSQAAAVALASSPLQLEIKVQNTSDYIASAGDTLRYTLRYRNNSDAVMENVSIRAAFTGEMFNMASARSSGALNSLTNTFTWNVATNPELAGIQPGQEGEVGVEIYLKDSFPIRRVSDKNYVLKVEGQIQSPTVLGGIAADQTLSVSRLETKVRGKIELAAPGYWRDAASGIVNKGVFPPKVNQATQYTVHWVIKNYSTDVGNIIVRAFLPPGTRFTDTVKSNITTKPSYNSASGEVIWQIPTIAATKGIVGQPAEAIFQVENTPAVNQVGEAIQLMGQSTLEAQDSFTGLAMQASAAEITTDLPDDTTLGRVDRRVQP